MIKVAICGEKLICKNIINYIYKKPDVKISYVFCSDKDWEADIPAECKRLKISYAIGDINKYDKALIQEEVDIIFSIQERRLLKEHILSIPRLGCINLHYGDLTRGFGGCYPITWAILKGEDFAGATLHYMDKNFDTGDIIAIKKVRIGTLSAREVYDSLSKAAYKLFCERFDSIISGNVESYKQNKENIGYYKANSIDFKKESYINFEGKTPEEVLRQIKAFTFPPFQYPKIVDLSNGKELEILGADLVKYNNGKKDLMLNCRISFGENK